MPYNPLKCLDIDLIVGHINHHMYIGRVAAAIEVQSELGAPLKSQRLFWGFLLLWISVQPINEPDTSSRAGSRSCYQTIQQNTSKRSG